jgi:enoyl-CoA hydratase
MDHMAYKNLEVAQDGVITTVTFTRPEVRNAINEELHAEIDHVMAVLDEDDSTHVVILTGAGSSFCGGGDLEWVLTMNADPVTSSRAIRAERKLQHLMLDYEKPIIAKVRGSAIGLGCSLALYCDMVFATPDSVFADPHVAVGLVAGDGGAVLWPQLVGYARARRYLLTGDPIRGAEAASIGLITEAVPDEDLDRVVADMASRLANGATHAIRWTKASINAGLKVSSGTVVDLAAAFENVSMMTRDNRAACEAFLAKEKPKFTGS